MRVAWNIALLSVSLLGRLGAVATCESLSTVRLPKTEITSAESITTGSLKPPGWQLTDLPAFCRVIGEIRSSPDSQIPFELWLPLKNWNHKFAGNGNVGFALGVSYGPLADKLKHGYATASVYTPNADERDAVSFALGHPERVTDFAYRAVHEMTLVSKSLIRSFYGTPSQHAYWIGESTGGRQGLMAAQRYPSDYDGILVGAPPINLTRYWPGQFDAGLAVSTDTEHQLTLPALNLLHAAVIAACDRNDGVADGLLEDPRSCTFDPATLQCSSNQASGCLTNGQVEAARRIYGGLKHPRTGAQLFPGPARGSEPFWGNLIPQQSPHPVSISYLRNLVFENPTWDWKTLDLRRPDAYDPIEKSEARLARLNATSADLRAFRQRGGKIIHWQGWSDERVPPQSSIDYYESVVAFVAGKHTDRRASMRKVQGFYRLFMAPGTAHARGNGAGPNTFDMLPALEAWVEHGIAPETVIATHTTAGKIDRSHPLCPYPKVAVYQETGSTTDGASFACREQ